MRRALAAAAALLVAGLAARADPPAAKARSARRDFLAGVEAHLKGDDPDAAADWASCLGKAAKGSDDESDCRLFSGMLREELAPNAPVPDKNGEARRAYVEGRDDYLRGDWKDANRRWRDCLSASERDPASRPDCLMAIELIRARRSAAAAAPAAAPPAAANGAADMTYLEGVIYYEKGDYIKAQKRWTACASFDADCRAGLARIDQLLGSSTAPDGKK